MMPMRRSLVAVVLVGAACLGCASGPEPSAFKNPVFYQYDSFAGPAAKGAIEQHYPPLDLNEAPPLPEYMGVSLMTGAVHLSRPKNWVIRAANSQPEHRYVEYVSPHEYMVAVYELVDSPVDPWLDVMQRYEDQAKDAGADLLGSRVPVATANAQGRGYFVRRAVAAAKGPMLNYSNEYLLRSDNRIVLLQIVHHDESMTPLEGELRRVVETFEVQ
jgi:hypothetical protein